MDSASWNLVPTENLTGHVGLECRVAAGSWRRDRDRLDLLLFEFTDGGAGPDSPALPIRRFTDQAGFSRQEIETDAVVLLLDFLEAKLSAPRWRRHSQQEMVEALYGRPRCE